MDTADIRKLRYKFIAIAMISLLLVMIFIGTAVNIASYYLAVRSIRKTLTDLSYQNEIIQNRTDAESPRIADIFAPEYLHNLFYIATFDETGEQIDAKSNTDTESELDKLRTYAYDVYQGQRNFAQKGNYFYLRRLGDDQCVVVLMNFSSEIAAIYRILFLTLAISILALLIMFVLVWRFSLKAIQPEIENNKRQKEFITNASHELKTPLAVIRANTELMEITSGENEWTRSTLDQVEHIDGLIRNLVQIARSQEKAADGTDEAIDASKAVSETADNYEALARQSQLTLTRSIDPDVTILADESKIRQLTTLLLDNAMKYCDENGTVNISLCKNKQEIVLAVSNHYKEGATVDYTRFFDRFYRQDQSHNIDRGGYGIGLSIAEGICKRYHGSIDVTWKNDIITFTCRLH